MLLEGKTAVITGCLQGIGRSTLDIFASNGANVFACCQFKTDEFVNHVKQLSEQYNVEIIPIYFDMMDNNQILQAAKLIHQYKKDIDILVNIAGIAKDALFHMITYEQMQITFQINFFSQIIFSQYITKLMLRNKKCKGSVITISSIAALDGNIGQLVYASSKAALIAATKTMSSELGPKGIRVNAIAPGIISTDMTKSISTDEMRRHMSRSKLKRSGKPDEVANVIMFLASDKADFITGEIIRVDGGIV